MITTPRITATWMILVMATILSWWLGHGLGVIGRKATAMTILVITFVKVRFVVMEFMEVRRAPELQRLQAKVCAGLSDWRAAVSRPQGGRTTAQRSR
jgi:hypothetical protein